jgi:methylglutaconyl-CoA hydratase
MNTSTPVLLDVDSRGVARVVLNRPERNNAYDGDLVQALLKGFDTLEQTAACAPSSSAATANIFRPAPI